LKLNLNIPIVQQVENVVQGLKGKKMSLKAYFKGNELEKTATLITLKG